jgi:hypothetical protein
MTRPPLRWYADKSHYHPELRPYLNDLCRALWNDRTSEERIRLYGARAACFVEAETPEAADFCILPLAWNYYLDRHRIHLAGQAVDRIHGAGRPAVIMSLGDFTADIPFRNSILFERSSYRSRRHQNGNLVNSIPAFIDDFLATYCGGKLGIRRKTETPVVGFCGQAGKNDPTFAYRRLRNSFQKNAYRLHLRKWEPAPFETTRFRRQILDLAAADPRIRTNYLLRKKYRAGYAAGIKDPHHPTRLEFVRNILDSDYTVCMRGGGNFSVRLYETLCLGRIPVFVDTDCLLPYDQAIDYRKYGVWIDAPDIPRIGEKIYSFHKSLSAARFEELQHSCRELWLDRLSINGFYSHFHEHFEKPDMDSAACPAS